MINEITFMQVRIVRLFCERFSLRVNEINRLFNENHIYEMIKDCYDSYHCGGDEIVYNDVLQIFRNNGVLAGRIANDDTNMTKKMDRLKWKGANKNVSITGAGN